MLREKLARKGTLGYPRDIASQSHESLPHSNWHLAPSKEPHPPQVNESKHAHQAE